MDLVAERLAQALEVFHGHRTLWIDARGGFFHAEPELELEAEGCRYVATLLRPSAQEVFEALLAAIPIEPAFRVRYGQAPELRPNLAAVG